MQRLSESVTEFLRSTVVITGLSAAAEELIVNSLDAGAQHVDISIDFSNFSLQVKDDGQGIPFHLMEGLFGTRYVSSKVLPQEQVNASRQPSHGCRGEAISSLGCVAELDVVTRIVGSAQAFRKCIRFGQSVAVEQYPHRVNYGTSVTVRRLFENVPVRQRTCQPRAEQVKLRDFVRRLAVLHHTVSFTLTDAVTEKVLVCTKPQISVAASFTALFGPQALTKMQEVGAEQSGYSLAGLLSPPFHEMCTWSKDTQLLYINNRWMRNTDAIGKFINQVYSATLRTKGVTTTRHHGGETKGIYPCFILHFACPLEDVDILSEPDKSIAIFRRPEVVEACVKQLIQVVYERYRPDKAAMITRMCALRNIESEMFEAMEHDTANYGVVNETALVDQVQQQEQGVLTSTREQYAVQPISPRPQGIAYQNAFFSSPDNEGYCGETSHDSIRPTQDTVVPRVESEYRVFMSRPTHKLDESWNLEEGLFSEYTYLAQSESPTQPSASAEQLRKLELTESSYQHVVATPTAALSEVQHSILSEMVEAPPLSDTPENGTNLFVAEGQPNDVETATVETNEAEGEGAEDLPTAACMESPLRTPSPTSEISLRNAGTSSGAEIFTCPYPRETIGAPTLQLPLNLDKQLLDDCRTIGQSDRKYILVTSGDQLLALDQHAADERLRLERFESRLDIQERHRSVMKSIALHPPCMLQVSEAKIDLLEHVGESFFHWNFKFELDRQDCTVMLHVVPVIKGEVLTANDFLEYVEYVSTRVGFPVSILRPPAITRILASKACRGAIMFGEPLEHHQCTKIIDGLKSCQFPFQCAHGRPSIVPLFDMTSAHRAKQSRSANRTNLADLPSRSRRAHQF